MRTSLLAVLLFSCTYHTIEPCPRMPLIISDSLPIQFWVNGEETFNEKDVCGIIKQDCFCQPFNCSDEIRIQFQDTTGQSYYLLVKDTEQNIIRAESFSEVSTGVYEVELDSQSPEVCQKVYFSIVKLDSSTNLITNGEWQTGTDGWTNQGDGVSWSSSVVAGEIFTSTSLLQMGGHSKEFTWSFGRVLYPGVYKITTKDGRSESGGGTVNFRYRIRLLLQDSIVSTILDTSLDEEAIGTATMLVESQFNAISIECINESAAFTQAIVEYLRLNEFDEVAFSDCLDLKESHDCTTLIEYENTSDFDNIAYEDGSPGPSFQIRIPAIFFEEENPQEQEDLELSNGVIVTLRQSIVEKRKLETGFMPNYMHRKLQKILMHDSVYIDGDYWKKRDSYDTNPVKKYNLKTASVLLTKYDSVEKNTI